MPLPLIGTDYLIKFLVDLLNIPSPTGFAEPAIAHVDTLGAVVKEIKQNGRLKLSRIGGIQWPTVETEGVWIFTSKGERIRGSVLIDTASGHIYSAAGSETPRNDDHRKVRLDARPPSEKET